VGNDPINAIDPSGRLGIEPAIAIGIKSVTVAGEASLGAVAGLATAVVGTGAAVTYDIHLVNQISQANGIATAAGANADLLNAQLGQKLAAQQQIQKGIAVPDSTNPDLAQLLSLRQTNPAAADILLNNILNQYSGFPPNLGFAEGQGGAATLLKGQILSRYGDDTGSFLAPFGTPFEQLSLPPGKDSLPLNSYEVLMPFDVSAGAIAPWYGQPGGGLQFYLGIQKVEDLMNQGFLRKINICR
jgi:hypothetical protein